MIKPTQYAVDISSIALIVIKENFLLLNDTFIMQLVPSVITSVVTVHTCYIYLLCCMPFCDIILFKCLF